MKRTLRVLVFLLMLPVTSVILFATTLGAILFYGLTGRWENPIKLVRRM